MVVISVYTYGVKIIKKFRWESGFLWGGSMEPTLCTNGSAGYLLQLSVNRTSLFIIYHVRASVAVSNAWNPNLQTCCDSISLEVLNKNSRLESVVLSISSHVNHTFGIEVVT